MYCLRGGQSDLQMSSSAQGIQKQKLTKLIKGQQFAKLFVELGWDRENLPSKPLEISVTSGRKFEVDRITEKRGFVVCVCDAGEDYPIHRDERRRLVAELSKHHYEHLLIICGQELQCWAVVIRPQNRPLRTIEIEWRESQDIQMLMEKLDGLIFDISEEGELGITDVVDRVRSAFMQNAEKITKKFYNQFRKELSAFADFIGGINDRVSKELYAALMLNRLMFIYFIQHKRFLDGDTDYLNNRLRKTQKKYGQNKFHDRFYRHFLRRLFAEGLGTPEQKRDPKLRAMLGKVPYLNGGLFDPHEIEQDNKHIKIPDQAFEDLFAFFNKYNWHLDTRATATGKDINPDVIGYIFEKYINDRATMGAYYTQEDITGYIARNTIIPYLLQRTKEKCKNAFDSDNGIWRFLHKNPDRYIYDAVRKGCDIPDAEIPAKIQRGMDKDTPKLIERRKHWNSKTKARFALPTEIWRETMARRERYFELKAKIEGGEVCEIDDLITYNLDIERFALDALRYYEGSDFIAAFYEAIAGRKALQSNQRTKRGITVLDPACGSGAFLFAALNILEPLYERCVERMKDFVASDDLQRQRGKRKGTKKYPQFRAVLKDIADHQNEKYWIYKTIILNNLYGVDLMKEAAEIAKLRLFLKLAAEAEYDPHKNNLGLEPLPDIDYNIRSGNSLVGFANMVDFEQSMAPTKGQQKLDMSDGLADEVRQQAEMVQRANTSFRQAQDTGDEIYQQAKVELGKRLAELNNKMNYYLSRGYGVNTEDDYENWLESHQPFHWLAEFYGIVESDGGFDVAIGNPPYVEYSETKKNYTVRNYKTLSSGNLYALFIERAIGLDIKVVGMIVQLPLVCTDRMSPVRCLFKDRINWFSTFDDRPAKLFSDLQHIRATIFLSSMSYGKTPFVKGSKYHRWYSGYREILLSDASYTDITEVCEEKAFPKIGDELGKKILGRLNVKNERCFLESSGMSLCYFHNAPQYWIRATDFVPYFWNQRDGHKRSVQVKHLNFVDQSNALAFCALINSTLFYWWFVLYSDCRHLNMREIKSFPFDPRSVDVETLGKMASIMVELMESYRENAVRKEAVYATTGQVAYDEFYPRHSKHILDKVDLILAKYYGLTDDELDYIINYDFKFRMGVA